jgi:hypothetical protein
MAGSNVNQNVRKILQEDLAIQKDLSRRIINMRALAKHILKRYQLQASLDAVISAIRRFQAEGVFEEHESALLNIFKDAIVTTKNSMAALTLALTPAEFYKRACSRDPAFGYHITTGSREVKLYIEQSSLEHVKQLFTKEELRHAEEDLSQISIVVRPEATQTRGVIARMTSELALANINVHGIIICTPEFLVYVKQKDIVKAHESILKLCSA